jgi:hypothetical protein
VAVGAERQRHPRGEPAGHVGEAVAEVRLGARAEHDAGAASLHGLDLGWLGVGRVDELPAPIEQPLARQPRDRPRAGRGEAVLDLGRLLGDVDVDRPGEALGLARELGDRSGARARSEWIASPAPTSGRRASAIVVAACQTCSAEVRKRRWSSRSGFAKPARS